MGWYDNQEEYQKRGIDYDLGACWEFNQPDFEFTLDDIEQVLAVWEGENDGDHWRWVILLNDGRYGFVQGGCDFTGWDCISNATTFIVDTPESAVALVRETFDSTVEQVSYELMQQLVNGKYITQSEKIDQRIDESKWDE